jgi:hypothetical protein
MPTRYELKKSFSEYYFLKVLIGTSFFKGKKFKKKLQNIRNQGFLAIFA